MNNSSDNKAVTDSANSSHPEDDMFDDLQRVTNESISAEENELKGATESSSKTSGYAALDDVSISEELLKESISKNENKSSKTYIIGGMLFLIILICVFVYAASSVFGNLTSNRVSAPVSNAGTVPASTNIGTGSRPAPQSPNDIADSISTNLTAGLPKSIDDVDAVQGNNNSSGEDVSRSAKSETQHPRVETTSKDEASMDKGVNQGESVTVDPIVQKEDASVMVSTSGEDVSFSPPPVSEEDRLYDKLLNVMPKEGIPTEAIKIDQNVIKRQLATGQMSVLEKGLITTREEVAGVTSKVNLVQGTVAELSKKLDSTMSDQVASGQKIDAISKQMAEENRNQDAQIKELKATLAAALQATEKLESRIAARSQANEKPKADTVPRASIRSEQAKSTKTPTVSIPVPTPGTAKPAVSEAPSKKSTSASTCGSATTSAVWRVKGVNSTSAYVVRSEDSFGLFLREGSELPGFGIVKSFDTASRAVCTTSGMVRR
ncbi:hypothetical protein ALQ64_01962 [Pseudomonas cannabina]|uniref:Uncharacterized protein n=1 Tax=Pseudomonas cannabina TaxID=86840 RepID=A0A3M3LQX4_PSECA|nr:hypothetical protein [Pseudomonas cannabina]RMN37391.1 hypothetical protein ALQ64_01962 [Pseudomonas cannabina]